VTVTDRESGKVMQVFQYAVSADGKTLTFSWYKAGQDKPSQNLVYDKE